VKAWWKKRKGKIIGVTFVLTIVGMLAAPYILWHLKSQVALSVVIVDKSVAKTTERKHAGLAWVLNHEKVAPPKGSSRFDSTTDYVGSRPATSGTRRRVAVPTTPTDLVYLADTYGVYASEAGQTPYDLRPQLIDGGMSVEELRSLITHLEPGGTLIGEFNTIGPPTPPAARALMSTTFGVKSTGWLVRYFEHLDLTPDLPKWLPTVWRRQTGFGWTFRGPGYVFITDLGRIQVLLEGIDTPREALSLHVDERVATSYGTIPTIRYDNWAEVLTADPKAEVLAAYDLRLTASGVKKMQGIPISGRFPAIIRTRTPQRTTYYFAGDWSERSESSRYDYTGIAHWKRRVASDERNSIEPLFWGIYVPLMQRIIDETVTNRRRDRATSQ
jgi:hypothetical protein